MKKKLFIAVLSVVALLLLAGVGYATWVISQSMEADSQGNIAVETVSDERLVVTVAPVSESAKSFIFGHTAAAETPTAGQWLSAKNDEPVEVLTVDFTVTVTKKGTVTFNTKDDIDILGAFLDVNDAALETKFMQNATFTEVADSRALSGDKYTITATFRAAIEWGTLTDGDNPYVFFNTKAVNGAIGAIYEDANTDFDLAAPKLLTAESTWADYALAYLTYFNTHFNSNLFHVRVTVQYHTGA